MIRSSPVAARDPHRLLGEVAVAVVDRVIDALGADHVVLGGRRGAEDLGADPLRDLGGGDPDPAGSGVDQHPVAGPQTTHHDQRRLGGRVVDDEAAPCSKLSASGSGTTWLAGTETNSA